jgi:hypothetical protein
VKLQEFERRARRVYEEIPDVYRTGIDGLTVSPDAPEHPEMPGIYTLGECVTEDHLSDYGSSETTRSIIVLYWGSFRALARENPDFDWDEEIWETVTHELRHHLESLAGDDALGGVDYAADETWKRFEGRDFDPWYWQYGDAEGDGLFRVEIAWYLEVPWSEAELGGAETIPFTWRGEQWRIARPEEMGDVHFVLVHGIGPGDEVLELVLVRRRGWWEQVKRLLGASRPTVLESEAEAEPLGEEGTGAHGRPSRPA